MIQEDTPQKKWLTILIPTLVTIFFGIYIGKKYIFTTLSDPKLTIGILQTISHPALDRTRQGFTDYLKKHYKDKKISFITQNGEGSISHLHTMAKSMQPKVDVFFAIATPAAQTVASIEKQKPVIIAAVTDAQQAGLIYPGTNVSGSSDMINIEYQISMLRSLIPHAKKVALIYNPGEVNSVVMIQKFEAELKKYAIETIKIGINSEAEINTAILIASKKAEVLLAPTDNLIVGAMPAVAALAIKAKIPLIVSDNPSVKRGALASAGIDYYESGELAAEALVEILTKGKKPSEVPIRYIKKKEIIINNTTLKALGLTVPKSLSQDVNLIN